MADHVKSGAAAQAEETATEQEDAIRRSGADRADSGDVEDVISRRAEKVGRSPDAPNPYDRPPPKRYGNPDRRM